MKIRLLNGKFHAASVKKSLFSIVSVLLMISLSATPAMAFGGVSSPATITLVDARSDGNFSIVFTPAATGGPACASASSVQMTGQTNTTTTPNGKAMLAVALSAYLAGRKVTIEGTGSCNEYPGYESISRIAATN